MEIQELKDLVVRNKIDPDIFLAELWKLSTGIKRRARRYPSKEVSIYRTRVFKEKILPENVLDLSYPPIEKSGLQRASRAGSQMFYASAGLPTTLAESRVKQDEYIIVSKWKNNEDLILQEVGLIKDENGIEGLYREIFTIKDESIYPYSSKIAEHLMGGDFISGLTYPSIINSNKSQNVAIKKNYADKSLSFIHATLYKVKAISDDSKYEVEEIDFATPTSEGFLDWKGRIKKWDVPPGCELRMVSNGWDWEAYKSDGTYVDPQ